MKPLAICGMGMTGGFGSGNEAFRNALRDGGVIPSAVTLEREGKTVHVPVFRAATDELTDYLSKRALRRIDHYGRMTLLAAAMAKQSAAWEVEPERLGVIVATGYGAMGMTSAFLDTVREDGDSCASPTSFASSVHNAAAAAVSMHLQVLGPSLTVSQFEMSVPVGLTCAAQWLEEDRVDAVLFGAVDEYTDVLAYTRERFFGLPSAQAEPFNFSAKTAVAGEGAAFLFLTTEEKAPLIRAVIDDVVLGDVELVAASLEGEPVILGIDGHPVCTRSYRALLPHISKVASYTDRYGSMPASVAFDICAAAAALRRKVFFKSCGTSSDWPVASRVERLKGERVTCVKADSDGTMAAIRCRRPL